MAINIAVRADINLLTTSLSKCSQHTPTARTLQRAELLHVAMVGIFPRFFEVQKPGLLDIQKSGTPQPTLVRY